MTTAAQRVDPALFARAGVEVPGSLTVMMLDTKSTFDSLIESHAPTPEKRDSILDNVLYKASPPRSPARRSTWRWRSSTP